MKKPLKPKNGFLFKRSLTAIVVLLLFCIVSTTPAQTPLSAEDIAQKALAATVYLKMMDKHGRTLGIGSGFFVQPNLIITNYHVIRGTTKGTAKLVGKDTLYNIEDVIAIDTKNDLALLKVTADGIKPLPLGDSDTVRIGETVYVAGNPKGLEGTFSDGIISSRRDKGILQMTAAISQGSSGGPVLNKKCEVIAISFAGHEDVDAQNLNFAIPSKYIKKLLERLKSDNPYNPSLQHPISAETYFQWGYAEHSLGNYYDALIFYTIAIRYKNDYAEVYYNRGTVYSAIGLPTFAISDYDTAIAIKPSLAEAYYSRGNVKFELKQYTDAISDYDTAIALKPDDARAYTNRGNSKLFLKQYTDAISDYDTAIAIKPDDTKAYCGRGIAKTRLKQYTAAFEDFDTAIALKPGLAESYYHRGVAKAFLEQYAAAIPDYDVAITLNPDYARAYLQRGLAKYLLDRTLEAKQDLRIALRLAIKAGDTDLKTEVEDFLHEHLNE